MVVILVRDGDLVLCFHLSASSFPVPLLIKLTFSIVCFWIICEKSGANVFSWSISQFLCICHDVFVTMDVCCNFTWGVIIPLGLFFFSSELLELSGVFCAPSINFRLFVYLFVLLFLWEWGFERKYIKSVDHLQPFSLYHSCQCMSMRPFPSFNLF